MTQTESSLEAAEIKPVKVEQQKSVLPSKMEGTEFEKYLLQEFTGKNTWRTLGGLAAKLQVDAKALAILLDLDKRFVRKLGDNDVILYATAKRVGEDKSKGNPKQQQVVIKPEHRFALAEICVISKLLNDVLDKHARTIFEENEETLSHLTKAMKSLDCAKSLFATATHAKLDKVI